MGNVVIKGKALVCINRPSNMTAHQWLDMLAATLDALKVVEWARFVVTIDACPLSVIVCINVPCEWSTEMVHEKLDALACDVWTRCGDDMNEYRKPHEGHARNFSPTYAHMYPDGEDKLAFNLNDAWSRARCEAKRNGTSAGAVEG